MHLNTIFSFRRRLCFIKLMIIVNILVMFIIIEINCRQSQKLFRRRMMTLKKAQSKLPIASNKEDINTLQLKKVAQTDSERDTVFVTNHVNADHMISLQRHRKSTKMERKLSTTEVGVQKINLETFNENDTVEEKPRTETTIKDYDDNNDTTLETRRQDENGTLSDVNTAEIDGKLADFHSNENQNVPFHEIERVRIQATKWLTINDTEKDNRINRHQFSYHLNSNLCSKNNPSIVILVMSAVNYTRNRHLIRSTWGSVHTDGSRQTIVFMLGETFPKNDTLQSEIEIESRKYGDIVQGDFVDTYKNLTYKHVMMIHWLTSHCDDVRTIVKIDDDVFVDVKKLANFSATYGSNTKCLYCHLIRNGHVKRDLKWAVTEKEYPFDFFPLYCGGAAYIMSMDVARRLHRASTDVRSFWIDDVFVTGFLARIARVKLRQFLPGSYGLLTFDDNTITISNSTIQSSMFFTGKFNWDLLMNLLFNLTTV